MYHDQGVEGANLHSIYPFEGNQGEEIQVEITGVAMNHDEVSVYVNGMKLDDTRVKERHDERLIVDLPPHNKHGIVKI